jgi:hypothetical protein
MRDLRGPALMAQATHIDEFRQLYKYVDGRLFVYRACYISGYYQSVPCWCIVTRKPDYLSELG